MERDGRRRAPPELGAMESGILVSVPERRRPAVWATYPLASSSKAALFAQAEKLSNDALTAFLSEQLD